MRRFGTGMVLAGAAVPAAVAYAALLGLGLHRHADPLAIAGSATVIVFGPALAAASVAAGTRTTVFAGVLAAWSGLLFLGLPIYFPGERAQAVASGIALLGGDPWDGVARQVADRLPAEPEVSNPEVPEATTLVDAMLAPPLELDDHQIALPYEGEGRRLSVPVAFERGEHTREATMMLDTGATYTTLPTAVLAELGIHPGPDDPVVELHTANGVREAYIVLIDRIWLGDLAVDDVAVATCDACASEESVGLLGLNVTGGYNLFIDADRREVVFTTRAGHDRRLDVAPFLDLSASFTRFPGGRVEVEVTFENDGQRPIGRASARIACGDHRWTVETEDLSPGEEAVVRRRLPAHERCGPYRVATHDSAW